MALTVVPFRGFYTSVHQCISEIVVFLVQTYPLNGWPSIRLGIYISVVEGCHQPSFIGQYPGAVYKSICG